MTYRDQLAYEAFGHRSLFGRSGARYWHEHELPLQAGNDYQARADAEFCEPAYAHAAEYRRKLYAEMGLVFT